MKKVGLVCAIGVMCFLSNASFAYVPSMGGSGGGSACSKPKFTHFMPGVKAEVKPGTEFSFVASANTHPSTIKVTVKGRVVDVHTGAKSENAFKVTGVLPSELKNTFARVTVTGEASSQCKGSEGWLVKLTE